MMKKRLMEFMAYKKISQKKFEGKCGLSNGFVDKVGDSIRTANLNKISTVYPELDIDWLKTGKGKMLKGEAAEYTINKKGSGVPYYDVDFEMGFDLMENDQTANPTYYIDFARYNKANYWVNATGNSMSPLINHGDIVALQHIPNWDGNILFGEVYAVVTEHYRTIKKIRKSSMGIEYLLFVPENLDGYDEQDVRKEMIRDVFRVLGCAKIM
jgi:SOS-response transcriptional repressor LexA